MRYSAAPLKNVISCTALYCTIAEHSTCVAASYLARLSQASCGRYDAALEKAKYNALALQQAAAAREDEVIGRP